MHLHPTSIPSLASLVGTIDKDEWELIVDEATAAPWSHELMSSPSTATRPPAPWTGSTAGFRDRTNPGGRIWPTQFAVRSEAT
jgi:hypothetical protein